MNVASKCGLTPQYEGLQALHDQYADQGFEVLGFPCNQFMGQEPGTAEEIREFCDTTYSVTFPLFEKIDVNGAQRHPVYEVLTATRDAEGEAGDVKWNFEKFLVSPDGEVVGRFRPQVAARRRRPRRRHRGQPPLVVTRSTAPRIEPASLDRTCSGSATQVRCLVGES